MSSARADAEVERLTLFLQGRSENDIKPEDESNPVMMKLKLENHALERDIYRADMERFECERLLYSTVSSVEHEILFHSGHLDIAEIEQHAVDQGNEICLLKKRIETLNVSLNESREQTKATFGEFVKKANEVKDLNAALELLRDTEPESRHEQENASLKEKMNVLKKENEKLRSQKEDIVNHKRNSERQLQEELVQLRAEVEKLRMREGIETAINDPSRKIQELNQEVDDLKQSLDYKKAECAHLRALELTFLKKQKQMDNLKLVLIEEQDSIDHERKEFMQQIEKLTEDNKSLEEIATANRDKYEKTVEKLDKQTITFSNEKAKFCHDLERVEEKWNKEVCRLDAKVEDLVKFRKEDQERFLECISEESKRCAELQETVDKLQEEAEVWGAERQRIIEEFDYECQRLVEEVQEMNSQRKAEKTRAETLERKQRWLAKCCKNIAGQRREEIDNLQKENWDLADHCDQMQTEQIEWLNELKDKMNECRKEHLNEQLKLMDRIDELEKENERLEEKSESVTEKWRTECELYELTVMLVRDDRAKDKEEFREKLHRKTVENESLAEAIRNLEVAKDGLETQLETQKAQSSEILQQTIESSRQALENYKVRVVHKALITAEEHKIAQNQLKNTICELEKNLKDANVAIGSWQKTVQDYAVSRANVAEEVEELKEKNKELRENMGVEVLDVDGEESEDSDSDSDDSDSDDSDDDSEAEEFSDEKTARNLLPKQPDEWEIIDDEQ